MLSNDSKAAADKTGRTATANQPNKETDGGRRSLIGSLGAGNHSEEKLVLYIPEKSLSNSSSPPTRSSIRRVSITDQKKDDQDYSSAGTKEGFDRFASIRRSRRYKKGPELAPTPQTTVSSSPPSTTLNSPSISQSKPEPFTSTATIRSRISTTPKNDLNKSESMRVPSKGTSSTSITAPENKILRAPARRRHDPRSMSTIEPRDVRLAMKTASSSPNESSGMVSSQNGTSVVQIRHGSQAPRNNVFSTTSNKSQLSSSPGTAERDEGFEESHSSLSETNSQSEATHLNNNQSVGNQLHSNSNHNPSSSSSKLDASNGSRGLQRRPSRTSITSLNKVNSFRDNNSNVISQNYKNSSRQSLLSSRSSLTSQTTVGTVKETSNGGTLNNKKSGSRTKISDLDSTYSTHPSAEQNHHMNSSRSNSNSSNGSASYSRSNSHNSTTDKKSNSKSGGGLTPRIFSFMKPTASSSAKDKIDNAPSTGSTTKPSKSSKITKKTFK